MAARKHDPNSMAYTGLLFRPTPDGGVSISVGDSPTENARTIRIVTYSAAEWSEVIAAVGIGVVEEPGVMVEHGAP